MKSIFTLLCFSVVFCNCNNSKEKEQEQKINELTAENQKLKEESNQKQEQDKQAQINNVLVNIDKYLITKAHYDPPGMGGITNGSITLENSLKVSIEKAIIEVKIIKDNGDVYSTNYYEVENIDPRDVKVITIPNSTRGTSVKARVIKLKSQQLTNGQLVSVGQ